MTGLWYIGGYIVHKLHDKFRNYKKWKKIELQQAISFYYNLTLKQRNLVI